MRRKVWDEGWSSDVSSGWSCPPFPTGLPEGRAHSRMVPLVPHASAALGWFSPRTSSSMRLGRWREGITSLSPPLQGTNTGSYLPPALPGRNINTLQQVWE